PVIEDVLGSGGEQLRAPVLVAQRASVDARRRAGDRRRIPLGVPVGLTNRLVLLSCRADLPNRKGPAMSAHPAPSIVELGLFSGAPQHENFSRLKDLAPTRAMHASTSPFAFPEGETVALPATYEYEGATKPTEDFFADTDTAALLVLKDGVVRHERYALTGGRDAHWISWSVAKSFVSALVGIAVAEAHIRSIDDPISDYVPVEPGSAYDGTSIRDVLQMSSGARWNEDYADPDSDIHRLGAAMTGASTLDAFVAHMVPEHQPGTVCRYNSADTQALGALLVHATQRSLADYMQEKLVEPLGMSAPGYWMLDSAGTE